MNERSLYLWAIVPPPPFEGKIDAVRKEFAENFHTNEALKRPVHLTLYKPFQLPVPIASKDIDKLRRWIAGQQRFTMELKNFGFFENPKNPVAFIDVVTNEDLKKLNTGIKVQTKTLFDIDEISKDTFHPHFTIGFRDISSAAFPEVKQAYSRRLFSAVFDVNDVCLFKHDGTRWKLLRRFPLAENIVEQGALW